MKQPRKTYSRIREAILVRVAELEMELRHWRRELERLEGLPLDSRESSPMRPGGASYPEEP